MAAKFSIKENNFPLRFRFKNCSPKSKQRERLEIKEMEIDSIGVEIEHDT